MMLASQLEEAFGNLSREDENNFVDYDHLEVFKKSVTKMAVKIYNECPGSLDGSLLFVLEDGSAFELDNPNQYSFAAHGSSWAGWFVSEEFQQLK